MNDLERHRLWMQYLLIVMRRAYPAATMNDVRNLTVNQAAFLTNTAGRD